MFFLEGDLTLGAYLRVNLIGKPKIQSLDGKHYIALRYVGVIGQVIGSGPQGVWRAFQNIPPQNSSSDHMEEEKK